MVRPRMILSTRLFLDFRRVEQRGDDSGRADADRDARLHELLPPLLAGFVPFAVVGHVIPLKRDFLRTSMRPRSTLEALR